MKNIIALIIIVLLFGYIGYSTLDYLSFFDYKTKKSRFSEINLVAVNDDNVGILMPLKIEVKPGDGKVLVNIDNLVFITDTQQSIQQAVQVVGEITNENLGGYDIIYSVKTNAEVVGGPSAGAALTIGTIAALYNKEVKNDVVITGAIGENGNILEVGGVLEKAQAAKDSGMKTFLVPEGEAVVIEPVEQCTGSGVSRSCTVLEKRTDIEDVVDIDVIEVSTVQEAMRYMFN